MLSIGYAGSVWSFYSVAIRFLWIAFMLRFFYLITKYEMHIRKNYHEKVQDLAIFSWNGFQTMINMHKRIDFGPSELRRLRVGVKNSFYHQLFFGIQVIIFLF